MKEIIKPRSIRLEASTACQLKCPSCPTASGELGQSLGSGFLKFEDFKRIIDDNPWVSHIELSNWGELFLNKELLRILRYAYRHNVTLAAKNGANLNNVSNEVLAALVRYRFEAITCSIDGASQETYSQYRRNGNFKNVIENIRTINKFKRAYRCRYPMLKWQFVVFGHNEHELGLARAMAKDLGMEFYVKLSWEDLYMEPFSPIKDAALVRSESGVDVATREEYRKKYGKEYIHDCCIEMWKTPQINYDGRLLGCCVNYWDNYGNVFKVGLLACLNNQKINDARDILMGRRTITEEMPCAQCKIYKKRKENNDWVAAEDVTQGYSHSRVYTMLENKILGPWLTQRLAWCVGQLRAPSKRPRRVASGVYPLHVPLPLDNRKDWQPFPVFRGTTAGLQLLTCHASILVPGHRPHPPHRHQEEELLLLLSGEVDLILQSAALGQGIEHRHLKAGEFVYYPGDFAHTLETTTTSAANYLMFKWHAGRRDNKPGLTCGCFSMVPQGADVKIAGGFRPHQIFAGPTAYLSKLQCHFSTLTPQAGYEPHVDNYNVAIVVLEGQVETLGRRASAYDVIFYASGEPHGMRNPGEVTAQYLVFEFHPLKNSFLYRMRSAKDRNGP